jgi:hypothetical protein
VTAILENNQNYRRLRILLPCSAIVLGISETWATRQSMGADGIAYLDMGDAYMRGDWHMAINAHWSPLYSWLLAVALKILKPSAHWEFPVVHLVNFAIFLGALTSFEFLLSGLVNYSLNEKLGRENGLARLPRWAWYAIGYTLFLWTAFRLIALGNVAPDMCVAAFVYLAAGLVVRIRGGSAKWTTFMLLGVVLGFGYLSKAIMFPLSFVFLGVALFSVGHLRNAAPRVLVAAFVFLAISAPFIVTLSSFIGRPTFGESGRLNYVWFVDKPDLSGLPTNTLKHPLRRIYETPTVYEFAKPIKGTFPPWYDPAYWWEGVEAHFDLKGQIRVLKLTTINYYNFLFLSESGLVASLIVLFSVGPPRFRSSLRGVCEGWYLLVPAAAGLGAFFLLNVEGRYIGPFVLLVWLGILSAVRVPKTEELRKPVIGAVLALVITMGVPVISSTVLDLANQRHRALPADWEVAQGLNQIGIQAGDKVGFIRRSPWGDFFWARLARIQIIAEIPPEEVDKFWASSPSVQADIINAFEKVGAKAVITSALPPCAPAAAWHKLGNTDFYAYLPHLEFSAQRN